MRTTFHLCYVARTVSLRSVLWQEVSNFSKTIYYKKMSLCIFFSGLDLLLNSLLLNFYCFSLFAFILFSLMFITCIMIRLFNSPKKITKTPKQSHKKYSNNKQNKHRNHNAFSIIKNILPMDAGVMVDFHTQKKIKFFHRVIIYHSTLIQGQYIYNI